MLIGATARVNCGQPVEGDDGSGWMIDDNDGGSCGGSHKRRILVRWEMA